MKKTNDYPIILIHGFLCWGTESKINQFMPCMGMWNGNARVAIMEEGVRCYTPHIGPSVKPIRDMSRTGVSLMKKEGFRR